MSTRLNIHTQRHATPELILQLDAGDRAGVILAIVDCSPVISSQSTAGKFGRRKRVEKIVG